MNLTRTQALDLLKQYNKDPFHIRHALTVEAVMGWFARELGYGDEADFWSAAGLLHDLDFEMWPDEHCIKSQELMRQAGLDEALITPPPVTAGGWPAMSSRSTRWRRSFLLVTSSRGSSAPLPSCVHPRAVPTWNSNL